MSCGESMDDRSVGSARHTRPVNWSMLGRPTGDHFKIVAGVPYCAGDPKPSIENVRIRRNRAQVVATALANFASRKPSKQYGCLGIFRPLYKVINLGTPSRRLRIFDGYTEPPKKEWPYSEIGQGGKSSKGRRPTHWRVVSAPNPYSVKISSSVGYCIGEPKPR